MKPAIQAIRAVAAEFVRRKTRPLMITIACIVAVLDCLAVWLVAAVNLWWLILLVPLLVLTVVVLLLGVLARRSLRLIGSKQTGRQKQSVRSYVDQLERVADNLQLPYHIVLFRIAQEIVRPRENGFVASVAHDSKTLAPDFLKLIKEFN